MYLEFKKYLFIFSPFKNERHKEKSKGILEIVLDLYFQTS